MWKEMTAGLMFRCVPLILCSWHISRKQSSLNLRRGDHGLIRSDGVMPTVFPWTKGHWHCLGVATGYVCSICPIALTSGWDVWKVHEDLGWKASETAFLLTGYCSSDLGCNTHDLKLLLKGFCTPRHPLQQSGRGKFIFSPCQLPWRCRGQV